MTYTVVKSNSVLYFPYLSTLTAAEKDKYSFVHENLQTKTWRDARGKLQNHWKQNHMSYMTRLFTMICLVIVVNTLFNLRSLTRYVCMQHDEVGGVFNFSGKTFTYLIADISARRMIFVSLSWSVRKLTFTLHWFVSVGYDETVGK